LIKSCAACAPGGRLGGMPHVTVGSRPRHLRRPKACGRRCDMKLTVIKNGTHSIAWKHADQVTKEILDFLP
jgi:hypothetical protein